MPTIFTTSRKIEKLELCISKLNEAYNLLLDRIKILENPPKFKVGQKVSVCYQIAVEIGIVIEVDTSFRMYRVYVPSKDEIVQKHEESISAYPCD